MQRQQRLKHPLNIALTKVQPGGKEGVAVVVGVVVNESTYAGLFEGLGWGCFYIPWDQPQQKAFTNAGTKTPASISQST